MTSPPAPNLPSISIVTPSYNQAPFLDVTLQSVLDQHYPNLEYIVMDGGSSDGSVEIIQRRCASLAAWMSEKDRGQYDAINKGFARSQGEIMGWLNSDDLYFAWTLKIVGEIFAGFPQIDWLTSGSIVQLDAAGRAVSCNAAEGYDARAFMLGRNAGVENWSHGYLQQESTFWRRKLWQRAGGYIDAQSKLAGDFDLWRRFFQAGAALYATPAPLAGFRRHAEQKTKLAGSQYAVEAQAYLLKNGGSIPGPLRIFWHNLMRRIPGGGRFFGWPAQWVIFDFATQSWRLRQSSFI